MDVSRNWEKSNKCCSIDKVGKSWLVNILLFAQAVHLKRKPNERERAALRIGVLTTGTYTPHKRVYFKCFKVAVAS